MFAPPAESEFPSAQILIGPVHGGRLPALHAQHLPGEHLPAGGDSGGALLRPARLHPAPATAGLCLQEDPGMTLGLGSDEVCI